jgi:hypothetical protein
MGETTSDVLGDRAFAIEVRVDAGEIALRISPDTAPLAGDPLKNCNIHVLVSNEETNSQFIRHRRDDWRIPNQCHKLFDAGTVFVSDKWHCVAWMAAYA